MSILLYICSNPVCIQIRNHQFCKDILTYHLLTDNLVYCFLSLHICYIIKHITFNYNTVPNPCDF